MKQYPSIPSWKEGAILGLPIIAFEKLDGSNIRAEWSKKKGWYKFGSRHQMIDTSHPELGEAIPLFLDKYGDNLARIFMKDKLYREAKSIIVYFEFFGPNSFAGLHDPNDNKDVILFDVNPIPKNFVLPRQLLKDFHDVELPRVVYEGNLNVSFRDAVISGEYEVAEGVVCKGEHQKKPYRVKIKTQAWLDRVKALYGEQGLKELA